MQGLAHALLEDHGDALGDRGRDYAARIVDEAKMLDQLIQDLLAYSRLSHIDVPLEAVDVAEALGGRRAQPPRGHLREAGCRAHRVRICRASGRIARC